MADFAASLADLLTGYSQQKEALDSTIDAQRRLALAGNPAALALYEQSRAVKATSDQFRQIAGSIRGFQQECDRTAVMSRNFAAAASPEAWRTLTDSFTLVAMQLGQYFIPVMVTAAQTVQRFADWLDKLSPSTKEGLGAAVTQATIFAGSGIAAGRLTGAASSVLGGASNIASAVGAKGVSSALGTGASIAGKMTGPIGTILGLGVTAYFDEQEAKSRGKQLEQHGYNPNVSAEMAANSPIVKQYQEMKDAGATKAELGKFLMGESNRLSHEFTAANDKNTWWSSIRNGSFGIGKIFGAGSETQKNVMDIQSQQEIVRRLTMDAVEGSSVAGTAKAAKAADVAAKPTGGKHTGGSDTEGLARHFMKVAPASYSAIDDARKQLQLRTLNMDPLDQKLRQMQFKFFQKFEDEWGKQLGEIARNSKEGGLS